MSTQLELTHWSAEKRQAAVDAALGREGWRLLLIRDDPKPAETEADRLNAARLAELRKQNLKGSNRIRYVR